MIDMKKWLAGLLWDLSEFSGIGLGRFAPRVFWWMIGCKGVLIVGKIGDTIEWDFKDDQFKDYPKHLRSGTFSADIVMIDIEKEHYGVYAEYGQDMIPFDKCKLIRKNK